MFLHDVFDTSTSIGTIANIHSDACLKAAEINVSYRLGVRGKTPAEVLTGTPHPSWLEMLGFQRFRKAA